MCLLAFCFVMFFFFLKKLALRLSQICKVEFHMQSALKNSACVLREKIVLYANI